MDAPFARAAGAFGAILERRQQLLTDTRTNALPRRDNVCHLRSANAR